MQALTIWIWTGTPGGECKQAVASVLQVTRLAGGGSAAGQLVEPMLRLVMSLMLGLVGGAWLAFALQPRGSSALRARLPPKAAVRYAPTYCLVPLTQTVDGSTARWS